MFGLLDALGVSLDAMVNLSLEMKNEIVFLWVWKHPLTFSLRSNHVKTYEKGHFAWSDNHQSYESTYITYHLHREELHNYQS